MTTHDAPARSIRRTRFPLALALLAGMLLLGVAPALGSGGDPHEVASLLIYPSVRSFADEGGSALETHVEIVNSSATVQRAFVFYVSGTTCSWCFVRDLTLVGNDAQLLRFESDSFGSSVITKVGDGVVETDSTTTCPGNDGFVVVVPVDGTGAPIVDNVFTGSSVTADLLQGTALSTLPFGFKGDVSNGDFQLSFDNLEYEKLPRLVAAQVAVPDPPAADGYEADLVLLTPSFDDGTAPTTTCSVEAFDENGDTAVVPNINFGCWTRISLNDLSSELEFGTWGVTDTSEQVWAILDCEVDGRSGSVIGSVEQRIGSGTPLRRNDPASPTTVSNSAWARVLQKAVTDGDFGAASIAPCNQPGFPGALEACDGVDNDCDGEIDEGFADFDADGVTDCIDGCIDFDRDGYGIGNECDGSDCDDLLATVYAGAPELCDGIENQCPGDSGFGFDDASCVPFDSPVQVQGTFGQEDETPFPVGIGVSAGDLDGDGDEETIFADLGAGRISWSRNTDGTLAAAVEIDGVFALAATPGDIDQDGDLDLVVADLGTAEVTWYENDGADPPVFSRNTIAGQNLVAHAIPADFDHDGDLDIAAAGDRAWWYPNLGGGLFGSAIHIMSIGADTDCELDPCLGQGGGSSGGGSAGGGLGAYPWIAASDLDLDGDVDMAIAVGAEDALYVITNYGDYLDYGGFAGELGISSVAIGDLNGDGIPQIVFASTDGAIGYYDKDGFSFVRTVIPTTATSAKSVSIVDMDLDGDLDILAASDGESATWYESNGDDPPDWTEHVVDASAGNFAALAVDLDRDGDQDVVITSDDGAAVSRNRTIHRSALYPESSLVLEDDVYDTVTIADLTGDGIPDLAVGSGDSESIDVFPGFGDGTFDTVNEIGVTSDVNGLRETVVADIDRDGLPDIVAAEEDLSWFANDGAGDFESERRIRSFGYFASVTAGDIDHDGDLDVIVGARESGCGEVGEVYLYRNDGSPRDGGWLEEFLFESLDTVNGVALADLDLNGTQDLVAGSASSENGELVVTLARHVPSTVGESLIVRPNLDSFVGNVYVAYDAPFQTSGTVRNWAKYGPASRYITPLIFEKTGGVPGVFNASDEYTVRGIGATRFTSATLLERYAFDPIAGSSDRVQVGWYYGFKMGAPPANGSRSSQSIYTNFAGDDEAPSWAEWGGTSIGPEITQDQPVSNAPIETLPFRVLSPGRDYSFQMEVVSSELCCADTLGGLPPVNGLALGDIDRDGDDDYVLATDDGVLWIGNRRTSATDGIDNDGDESVDEADEARFLPTDLNDLSGLDGGLTAASSVNVADLDGDGDLDILAADEAAQRLVRYENRDGLGDTWLVHEVSTAGLLLPRTVDVGDLDRDGDPDLAVVYGGSGVYTHDNVGGQYGFDAEMIPANPIYSGDRVPLTRVDMRVNARVGDSTPRLEQLSLTFFESEGFADGPTLNGLFERLLWYRDDGDGAFEPDADGSQDVLLGTLDDLTPVGFKTTIAPDDPTDPNLRIQAPASFWLAVDVAEGAGSVGVELLTPYFAGDDPVSDANFGVTLRNEPEPQVVGGQITISGSIGVEILPDLTLPSDDEFSLREAVLEANALPGNDLITVPAGLYPLTITGGGEELANTGDLDLTDPDGLRIRGQGVGVTIIDASALGDRIFHVLAGDLVLEQLTLTGATIAGNGGAIRLETGASATVRDVVLSANAAVDGGAISIDGTLTLERVQLLDNNASGNGGAIFNSDGTLVVTDSTIANNTAQRHGGLSNGSEATLVRTTVSGNVSTAPGGGIGNDNTLTLQSSALVDNESLGSDGGGLSTVNAVSTTLANTVIAGNRSDEGGADCAGSVTSGGHNLIVDTFTCAISGQQPSDLTGLDPQLGPLQLNGGTTFTHLPSPTSPLLDAGSCADETADQRGFERPVDLPDSGFTNADDGCDIGPVEVGLGPVVQRLEVPIRWCGVSGAPSISDPDPLVAQQLTNDVLRGRSEIASDEIFEPQGNLRLRSGANAKIPDYPVLADPISSPGSMPGDVRINPDAGDFDEFHQLIADCRAAWEDPLTGDPTITGITAVHINRFVDALGNPLTLLGLGGRAELGNPIQQAVAGRVMVVDNAYRLAANPPDLVDRLVGHEMGHALSLAHGNGLDDDFDTVIDNLDDAAVGLPTFDGPNLMQYRNGVLLSQAQVLRAREHAATTIPDVTLGEFIGTSVDNVPLEEGFQNLLDYGFQNLLDYLATEGGFQNLLDYLGSDPGFQNLLDYLESDPGFQNLLDFLATDPGFQNLLDYLDANPGFQNLLDFFEQQSDFGFQNLLDFGTEFGATETTVYASTAGIFPPAEIQPTSSYFFYLDLDQSDATGGIPSLFGFPLIENQTTQDEEEGIDLIIETVYSAECVGTDCEQTGVQKVYEYNGTDFGIPTETTAEQPLNTGVNLLIDNGGALVVNDLPQIGATIRATLSTATLQAASGGLWSPGDPFDLQVASAIEISGVLPRVGPGETPPNPVELDPQCLDCADCPGYPECDETGTPLDLGGATRIVTDVVAAEIDPEVGELPQCAVIPDEAAPGQSVVLRATDFPTDRAQPIDVFFNNGPSPLLTDEAPVFDAGDGSIEFTLPVPFTSPSGNVEFEVVLRTFATVAECFVTVGLAACADFDADTLCDANDPDDDNDGALDAVDDDDFNAFVCSDIDGDTCDDCTNGSFNPAADGTDTDGDSLCDAGDACPEDNPNDPDGDGVCSGAGNPGLGTDGNDVCPTVPDALQEDLDGDGVGDACDCPADPDPQPQGHWHRQCLGTPSPYGIDPGRNGNGPQAPDEPDFWENGAAGSTLTCSEDILHGNLVPFWDDPNLNGVMGLTCAAMEATPPSDRCERARKQTVALVLNLCSDKIGAGCALVEEDGFVPAECGGSETVGDLLEWALETLGTGPDTDDCRQVSSCAAALNEGTGLAGEARSAVPGPEVSGESAGDTLGPRGGRRSDRSGPPPRPEKRPTGRRR